MSQPLARLLHVRVIVSMVPLLEREPDVLFRIAIHWRGSHDWLL